ncbi:nucleotide-binding alpha-beta plait domain-containing protein [Tanacetum coccineum]
MGTFRSKEDDVQQISTSVFVTNFPDQFYAKDLWTTCKQYGYVVDAFIPNRKSKAGKRFGFVRFIKIFDVDRLVNNLCTVWVGRHKIHANLARFQRPPLYKNNNQAKIGESMHNLGVPLKTKGPNGTSNSYAHVVKGSQSHNLDSENIPAMMLDDSCLNQQNFNCCLMGKVKNFESLSNLKVVLVNEGFDNIDLKYMGGYWVMIKFQSEEAKKTFQSNVGIGTWFAKIQQASTDFFVEGRVALVDIEGVPLKIWSDNTFKRIASKWGTLIHVDSHEDGNFYTKRICINTNITSNILESFKIIYRDEELEGDSDTEAVPDTIFDDASIHINAENASVEKQKTHSEDPFNIYKLLTKNKENNHKEFNLEDSLKYPPGFTPINDNVNSEGQSNKFIGERLNNIQEEVLKDKFNEDAAESTCSGHFKKSNISREDDFEIVKVRDPVGFYVVGKDRTRMWYLDILAHGEKPIQGTQFVSIDQAYIFYVAYDKKAGFDVRRGGEYKAVGFGDVTTKYFHCTREGFLPNPKEKFGVKSLDVDISEHSEVSDGFETFKDPKKKQTRRKPTFRCGCLASLTIKRIGNVFEVMMIGWLGFSGLMKKLSGTMLLLVILFLLMPHFDLTKAFGKDLKVVVTDQDPSMKIAIAECFPDTRHHLCMWHIMMKLGTKISPKVFEREWERMINEFELGENKWLGDMFDLRESWIHAYLRDVHMDGLMHTTSRSESKNHFFDEMFASYKYCIALSVVQTKNTETYSVRDTQYHIFKGSKQFPVYQIFESTIDRLVHDLDKLHIYKDKMKELLNQAEIDVPTVPKVSRNALISVMLGVDEPDNVLIGNLNLSKVKGTGCFSRMKPVAEVTVEEIAKRMTRSVCGGKEGHNKRTCTNEPASKKPKVQAAPKGKVAPKQQAS